MNDAQTLESLLGFGGVHGGSAVGEQRAGQAAFQKCLAEAMSQLFGGLAPIPLRVTGQAGMVVQNAQQLRIHPFGFGAEDLVRAFMEIQMPQGIDVGDLVTADFAALQTGLRPLHAGGRLPTAYGLAQPTMAFHVADNRGVGRHAAVARLSGGGRTQVVHVQLIAPALVRRILRFQQPSELGVHPLGLTGFPPDLRPRLPHRFRPLGSRQVLPMLYCR